MKRKRKTIKKSMIECLNIAGEILLLLRVSGSSIWTSFSREEF